METMEHIREFKDQLFKRGRECGFSDMEIYIQSSENFEVGVFGKEIDKYNVSKDRGLCFRGIYNGKMGYAFAEVLDNDSIDMLIRDAADNAGAVEAKDVDEIYNGSGTYEFDKFDGFNENLAKVKPEDKIKFAMDMEDHAFRLDKRVSSIDDCILYTGEEERIIMNTRGLDLNYRSNGALAYVSVIVKEGNDVKTGDMFKVTGDFESLKPEELSSGAVDEAVSMLGAKPVESGNYPVILRHDAAYALLRTFSSIFSASNAQKGLSLLKGRVGTEIADSKITIIDNPLLEGSLTSSPFDAEGVKSAYKEVVSKGVLTTLLHSLKTARKDGVNSTGNASKASYKSPVEVAPTNMYIKSGDKTYDELVKCMGEGVIITSLQGLHSGANQISGDFSLAALGYYVKNGEVVMPVEQITVAGNFYKLLMDTAEVGSDLKYSLPQRGSTFGSPSILIKNLTISGK